MAVTGTKVNPPPINVPVVDPRSGMPTRALTDFLGSLWRRTGGNDDEVDAILRLLSTTGYLRTEEGAAGGSGGGATDLGSVFALMESQVNRYASEVASLRQEIGALRYSVSGSAHDPQASQAADAAQAMSLAMPGRQGKPDMSPAAMLMSMFQRSGVVIEQGSNANGSWIRLGDWQLVITEMTVSANLTGYQITTLPKGFISGPHTSLTFSTDATGGTGSDADWRNRLHQFVAVVNGVDFDEVRVLFRNANYSTTDVEGTAFIMAVGRYQ